jgi:nascent polypeptide-associated complex subunit alpha
MIPGMGKIDPKKMQAMMKQMGIGQEEIEAERVIIEKSDGKIVIENPSVQKITMQGQSSFQVSGQITEQSNEPFTEEDVKLVAEKTGKDEEEARKVLEETNGDIAEAIVKLAE